MPLSLAPQPLSAAQAAVKRGASHRRPPCRPRRLPRCSAADGEEAGPSGRAASDLPPLKQMPYRAIAALAAAGFADSAYLTATKLLNVAPACPLGGGAAGCSDILSSEYATLFGVVPLSAVGMLAYGGVAALALAGTRQARAADAAGAGASSSGDGEPTEAQHAAESPLRTAVLAGGLALTSCSAVLLWLLATKFDGALCPYCLASAACSFSVAALAASGFRARELGDAAAPGAGVVATTLLLLSLGLGSPDLSLAGGYDLDYSLPAVTTSSTQQGVALAQRLRDGGARMYGAFWCSHCYDQKQAFGAEAMEAFPYVECYPDGLHKDTKLAEVCVAAPGGLTGFPTWVMPDGSQLVGEQSFEQLEVALDKALAATAAATTS